MRLTLALLSVPTLLAGQERPVPHVNPPGPALTFDFPGLRIGVAEYDEGRTGTTVFWFPAGVMAAVDVRGGAPGTMFTDALRLGNTGITIDGVVFSGGSAYGLGAASGAGLGLKAVRVKQGHWPWPAVFAGAIIYDIAGRRLSTLTPDEALGMAAFNAAQEGRFPLGPRGAGMSAMQGYYFADTATRYANWPHSGQGGAFRQVGPTKIAVFTVVNALGTVVDRQGRVVRCAYAPTAGQGCGLASDWLARRLRLGDSTRAPGQEEGAGLTTNTTISLVVTNQKLDRRDLERLAIQVHTSMARGIQPFSTAEDGDALFAVTTAEVENPALSPMDLSTIASEVAWDAILASVPPLDPAHAAARVHISTAELDAVTGTYEFSSGAQVEVRREGESLRTTLTGSGGFFFSARGNNLTPVGPGEFMIDGPRADHVRFERSGDRVTVLTLNPGQWAQRAQRVP